DRSESKAGGEVPRKGRARRFREARELKQGFDDGLFREGEGTLADLDLDDEESDDEDEYDDESGDEWDEDDPLDDDPLHEDDRRRPSGAASVAGPATRGSALSASMSKRAIASTTTSSLIASVCARACSVATTMFGASTSKWRRSAARVSE